MPKYCGTHWNSVKRQSGDLPAGLNLKQSPQAKELVAGIAPRLFAEPVDVGLLEIEIDEQANALVIKLKRKDKDSIIANQQVEIEALRAQLAAAKMVNAPPQVERQLTDDANQLFNEMDAADKSDAGSSAGTVSCDGCGREFKRAGWLKDGLCKKCRGD